MPGGLETCVHASCLGRRWRGYHAPMTTPDLDIEGFRRRLGEERRQLADTADVRRDAADLGDLEPAGVGRAARTDALQEQAMARATRARAEQRIKLIDAALARIAAGTFGECSHCGESIDPRRLDADPAVGLCLRCAERTT
jgi:RNA polymerase-binding transcription factor